MGGSDLSLFPILESSVIKRFKELGHETDLLMLSDYATRTFESINNNQELLSWGSVYESLMKIPVADGDEVLAVYRADQESDFWANKGSEVYLKYLQNNANIIKQKRIIICDSSLSTKKFPDELVLKLAALHPAETLMKVERRAADNNLLLGFKFGISIFPRQKCAIAPLPVPISYIEYVENYGYPRMEQIFPYYTERHFLNPQLKGLLIADPKKIDALITQFEVLSKTPETTLTDYGQLRSSYELLNEKYTIEEPDAEGKYALLRSMLMQELNSPNLWKMIRYCYSVSSIDYSIELATVHFALERLARFKEDEGEDTGQESSTFDRIFRSLSEATLANDQNAMSELSQLRFL